MPRKISIYLDDRGYSAMDQLSKSCLMDLCVELVRRMDGADLQGDELLDKLLEYATPVVRARRDAMPRFHPGSRYAKQGRESLV